MPVVASTDATYATRSGVLGRAASHGAGYTKVTALADFDLKTNAADSAISAGQGRRSFRGTGWRETDALSHAISNNLLPAADQTIAGGNLNYVIELRGVNKAASAADTNAATIERIGCGVFRPYNEESAKKDVEDIFLPLGEYAAASATNTSGLLEEMQNNQKVVTDTTSNVIGQAAYTPGVTPTAVPAPVIAAPDAIV